MPVHRKRQRARTPKNKTKRKRAFTTVRRDGRECALFSAHSAGAPPTARSHVACSTPLYFAESTRVLAAQYSSTSRKVLSNTPQRIPPFSAPRHSPVEDSRRDKGAARLIRRTKRIRTQTRSLLGGHRKRPITPNQPHAPIGNKPHTPLRFRDEPYPRHPFHARPSAPPPAGSACPSCNSTKNTFQKQL